MNEAKAKEYINELCKQFKTPENFKYDTVMQRYIDYFKSLPEFLADEIMDGVFKNCVYFPQIADLEKYKPSFEGSGGSAKYTEPKQEYCLKCHNSGFIPYCVWKPDLGAWYEYFAVCNCEMGKWQNERQGEGYKFPTIRAIVQRAERDNKCLVCRLSDLIGQICTPPEELDFDKEVNT